MRTVPFWVIILQVELLITTCSIITQKITVLSYSMVEA
jgi:hypothetical protein